MCLNWVGLRVLIAGGALQGAGWNLQDTDGNDHLFFAQDDGSGILEVLISTIRRDGWWGCGGWCDYAHAGGSTGVTKSRIKNHRKNYPPGCSIRKKKGKMIAFFNEHPNVDQQQKHPKFQEVCRFPKDLCSVVSDNNVPSNC